MQQEIRKLGKGSLIALLGQGSARFFWLLTQMILARVLMPEEFGIFAIGWTILQIGSLLVPLGLHQAVIYYGAQYWHEKPLLKGVLYQSVLLTALQGSLASVLLYVTADWGAYALFKAPSLAKVLKVLALSLPVAALLRVAASATRITKEMSFSVIVRDIVPGSTLLVVTGLMAYVFKVHSVLPYAQAVFFAYLAGLLLAVLFLWKLFLASAPSQHSFLPVKQLVLYALPTSLAGVLGMLTLRVDRLLLGGLASAEAAGIYQAASQPAALLVMVISALNSIFAPLVAHLFHQKAHEEIRQLFCVSTKWGIYAVLPLWLIFLVDASGILRWLFGPSYTSGTLVMRLLLFAQMINVATGGVGFLLIMSGHQWDWFRLSLVAFISNLVLGFSLIPRAGTAGAAIATIVSSLLLYGGGVLWARRVLGFWPYTRSFIKGALAGGGVVGILWLMPVEVRLSADLLRGLLVFVGKTALGYSVFLVIIVLLGLDREDRALITAIQAKARALWRAP